MSNKKVLELPFIEYPALKTELTTILKKYGLWSFSNDQPLQPTRQSYEKGLYAEAYKKIYEFIQMSHMVEQQTEYWFSKSPQTNADSKSDPANEYIRAATQYGLQFNQRVTGLTQSVIDQGLQRTSNLIGQNVLGELFRDQGVPDFNTLISGDISAAIGNQYLGNFLQTMAGWGGSFYYWNASLTTPGDGSISVGNLIKNGGSVMIGTGGAAVSTPVAKSLNEYYFDNGNAITDFVISDIKTFTAGNILKSTSDSIDSFLSIKNTQSPLLVQLKLVVQSVNILFARYMIGHFAPGPHSVLAYSGGLTQVNVNGNWATTTYLDGSSYSQNSVTNIVNWTKPGSNGDVVALADGSERVDTFGAIADNSVAVPKDITVYNIDGSVTESSGSGLQYANVNGNQELVKGGLGDNTYVFSSLTATDNIVLADQDGVGEISVGSTALGGVLTQLSANLFQDANGLQYAFNGQTDTLAVSGNSLNGAHVTIDNFNLAQAQTSANGYLGIKITEQTALEASTAITPFAPGSTTPANVSVTAQGDTQSLTFNVSAASQIARTFTLTATGVTAGLFANTGADMLDFSSGTVSLTVPAGSTSVTIGLVYTGGSTQAQTVKLSSTLQASNGVAATASDNSLSVTFNAITATSGSTTIKGVSGTLPAGPSTPNAIVPATIYLLDGGNDAATGTSGNDLIGASVTGYGGPDPATGSFTLASGGRVYAAAGNNTIAGGGGNDVIMVGNGNNQIFADGVESISTALTHNGGPANGNKGDLIGTGNGNNTIVAGEGNDNIFLGNGNNLVIGGSGQQIILASLVDSSAYLDWSWSPVTQPGGVVIDEYVDNYFTGPTAAAPTGYEGSLWAYGSGPLLPVGVGNDTIFGGTGDTDMALSNGNNYVDAGGGNDTIQAGIGQNTIFGGSGNDSIFGGGGNDYIDAESGNDLIVGQGGNVTIYGGTGNSSVYAGDGNAQWATSKTGTTHVEAGSGNTVVHGSGGYDTLIGGSGLTTIFGGAGKEYIQAGTGNNYLQAGAGDSTIIGGVGSDTIYGGTGNNVLYAGDGGTDALATFVTAGAGSTTIYGGNGVQNFYAGAGNAEIHMGDGGDTVSSDYAQLSTGNATVYGGSGIDHIFGGAGAALIYAGDGGILGNAAFVQAGAGNTTVYGGAGIDNLVGGSGSSTLYGGSGGGADGATSLSGGTGHTTLVAGSGTDILSGNTTGGTTTYQINADAGSVSINNSQASDLLVFGAGISESDITVTASGGTNPVVLALAQGGSVTMAAGSLAQVAFADGSTATLAQLTAPSYSSGTSTYSTVNAVAGASTRSVLLTGDANVSATANDLGDILHANSGEDTLIAGHGADTLVGGGGTVDYMLASGTQTTQIQNSGQNDVLSYAAGVSASNLSVSASTVVGGGTSYTIVNQLGGSAVVAGGANGNLDEIDFADGSTASLSQLLAQATTGSTAVTSAVSTTMAGGIQNLLLTGSTGLVATGNNLNDVITTNSGNSTLVAGAGNATLVGGSGSTTYDVNAGAGAVLISKSGAADKLVFGTGITERDLAISSSTVGGVTTTTLALLDGNSVVIQGGSLNAITFGNGDTATLAQLFASFTAGTTLYTNVSATAASGITTVDVLGSNVSATANSGNDSLLANGNNDTLVAGTGNSTLNGAGTGERYVIAAGAQTTTLGQSGWSDTLAYGTGVTAAHLGATAILAGDGSTTVTIRNDLGGSVVINNASSSALDNISFADGSSASISALLASATTGSTAATSAVSVTLADSTQNMILTGSANITATANDTNNVVIKANTGSDTLIAGAGNATLVGSSGTTTYDINQGSGNVVISSSGSADHLVFGPGINAGDLAISSTVLGGVTTVTLADTLGSSVVIQDGKLGQISFADGTNISMAQLLSAWTDVSGTLYTNTGGTVAGAATHADLVAAGVSLTANSLGNVLSTRSDNDTLISGGANNSDTLIGGGYADTFKVVANSATTTLQQTSFADTLAYGSGTRRSNLSATAALAQDGSQTVTLVNSSGGQVVLDNGVYSGLDQITFADGGTASLSAILAQATTGTTAATTAVNTTLGGGIQNMALTSTGNLTVTGNGLNDVITANTGNDMLVAGSGNATLVSGRGTDTLVGGTGTSEYLVANGTQTAVIRQSNTQDVLAYGAGVSAANLSVSAAWVSSNTMAFTLKNSLGGSVIVGPSSTGPLDEILFADGSTASLNTMLGNLTTGITAATSATSVVLGAAIRNMGLTGTANITATANALADRITANSGSDTLVAGAGNDTLVGGSGLDTFNIASTSGAITLVNGNASQGSTVQLASDINPATLVFKLQGNDLVISVPGSTASARLTGYLQNTQAWHLGNPAGAVAIPYFFIPGMGPQTLPANSQSINMDASLSAASLKVTRSGLDLVLTGAGTDSLTITGWYKDPAHLPAVHVQFADGSSISSATLTADGLVVDGTGGNRQLVAVAGFGNTLLGGPNDTLVGGGGADTMVGGGGTEKYVVANGAQTTIIRQSGSTDVLTYGSGVTAANLGVTAAWTSGTTMAFTLKNSLGGSVVVGPGTSGPLDHISFADGSGASLNTMVANLTTGITAATSATNVTLGAYTHNMALTGTASITATANNFADVITANSGNDTLVAGTGNDTLVGGSGLDTFKLGATAGAITLVNKNATQGANVVLGGDINIANLSYTLNGNDLVIGVAGSTASATLTGYRLNQQAWHMSGAQGAVPLPFMFTSGMGKQTQPVTNQPVVVGSDIAPASVHVTRNGVDLLISAGTDSLTITGWYSNPANMPTSTLTLGDGTRLSSATLTADGLTLDGSAGNVKLTGLAGFANTLIGGANDTLVGGGGNDTFVIANGAGNVTLSDTGSNNALQSGDAYRGSASYANGAITLQSYQNSDVLTLTGINPDDVLGSAPLQFINGSAASYALSNIVNIAGDGDVLVHGTNMTNMLVAGSGNDTLQAATTDITDAFVAGSGLVTMYGGTGAETFTVNNSADVVTANSHAQSNTLITTVNFVVPDNVRYVTARTGGLTLTGNAQGSEYDLTNAAGTRVITGTGIDTLDVFSFSAQEDDFVINNSADVISLSKPSSTDGFVVESSVSYTGPAVATLMGIGSADITLVGGGALLVQGNNGNDVLRGANLRSGSGLDVLIGGTGNNSFDITRVDDVIQAQANAISNSVTLELNGSTPLSYVLPANVTQLTAAYYGDASLTVTGNNLNDTLSGGSSNVTLVAGSGIDTLIGRYGGTYVINNAADVVQSLGRGRVQTNVSYTAPDGVSEIDGEGNGNLTLTGGAGTNSVLVAGAGVSTLVGGGGGNDVFVINNAADVIQESASTGANNFESSSVSITIAANVQNLSGLGTADLVLTGNDLGDGLSGGSNSGNDTLIGGNGNDTLTSGMGIDVLQGGGGDDVFVVHNAADKIIKGVNAGNNTEQTDVSITLADNVQNLIDIGTSGIMLTGNALNDRMVTNDYGNDTLISGTGIDTLVGGRNGNYTFVINNSADTIQLANDPSANVFQTNVSYTLAANLTSITGVGSGNIAITGNTLSNTLTANNATDTLIAGSGHATLVGGTGIDVFQINSSADVIRASASAALNIVQSSVSYTAGANISDVVLLGSSNLAAIANSGTDLLVGNTGSDTLTGGTGSNVLQAQGSGTNTLKDASGSAALLAGAGNDALTGGTGVAFFAAGAGTDVISLGSGTASNAVVGFNANDGKASITANTSIHNDVLSLGGGIAYANLTFSKSGNNLILNTGGTSAITLTNWYSASTNQDFATLQVIEQSATTYNASSTNALYNSEVETFDFSKLVAAFNAASAPANWALSNALLTDHLSSSNSVALGGDLAYYDGLNSGGLSGMNLATAVSTLQSTSFGKTAQTLDAWGGVSGGNNRLH